MKKQEIAQKALELCTKYECRIPVPVVKIAQDLGIAVHEVELSQEDGATTPSGILTRDTQTSEWTILVNVDDAPTRKRFTIAHELGHFVLHRTQTGTFVDTFDAGETFYRDGDTSQTTEKQANYFAACLLMPEPIVREKWPTCADPAAAAYQFYVSEVSMTFRLKELQLITI